MSLQLNRAVDNKRAVGLFSTGIRNGDNKDDGGPAQRRTQRSAQPRAGRVSSSRFPQPMTTTMTRLRRVIIIGVS